MYSAISHLLFARYLSETGDNTTRSRSRRLKIFQGIFLAPDNRAALVLLASRIHGVVNMIEKFNIVDASRLPPPTVDFRSHLRV